RLGRGVLIGFGEAYLTGAWDADDLGGFLPVLAGDLPHRGPPALQRARAALDPAAAGSAGAARARRPSATEPRGEHARQLPTQHRAPLRPVQRPVRAVPRPGSELLVGPVPPR